MEILTERMRNGLERNAFTIRSIHTPYMVKVDCEPVLRFRWDIDTETWEYVSLKHYAYTSEILEPNEIQIRIPLDDNSPTVHKPYVDDLSDAGTVEKMENAIRMVRGLPEPLCAMNLKKAIVTKNRGHN